MLVLFICFGDLVRPEQAKQNLVPPSSGELVCVLNEIMNTNGCGEYDKCTNESDDYVGTSSYIQK